MNSKLELDVCYCVYGWHHLMKTTEVTVGLVESNGSLPPGGWLKVTCGLTSCTPAPGPMRGNEYRKTLPFYINNYDLLFQCSQTFFSYLIVYL